MRFENLVAECCCGPVYDMAPKNGCCIDRLSNHPNPRPPSYHALTNLAETHSGIARLGTARRTLNAAVSWAVDTGRLLVLEPSDYRLVAVRAPDPDGHDHPIQDLLDWRAPFQALLARCLAGTLKPFAQRDAPSVR